MKQLVRIVGGRLKGKKLSFPKVKGLRPTPNRVRETLFNWLMHDIQGAYCLDAFAGSGALGLEAYSRGASKVVFVERSVAAFAQLKTVIESFNTTDLQLFRTDARDYLKQVTIPFDIVFLDPPFSKGFINSCLPLLELNHVLKPRGFVYLESEQEVTINEDVWEILRLKHAGDVVYGLYRKKAN